MEKGRLAILPGAGTGTKPGVLYASDLERVVATARIIEERCSGLRAEFTEQLRERNFGELEGKLFSEVDWDGFWTLPDDESRYEAESLNDFTLRIARFMMELQERHPEETVLLLGHIGVMNRLNYLIDPANFKFVKYPNAEVVEFDSERILQNSTGLLS